MISVRAFAPINALPDCKMLGFRLSATKPEPSSRLSCARDRFASDRRRMRECITIAIKEEGSDGTTVR